MSKLKHVVKKAARTATIIGIALVIIALSASLAMLLRPEAPSSVSAINLRVRTDEGGSGRERKADRTNGDHGRVGKRPRGSDGRALASEGGSPEDNKGRDDDRGGADEGEAGGADDGEAGGADDGEAGGADDGEAGGADDGEAGGADDGGAGGADDGEATDRSED